jgi:hypothetical protein
MLDLNEWNRLLQELYDAGEPTIMAAGYRLWGALAVILVVWHGLMAALGRGFSGDALFALIMGLLWPYVMLEAYDSPVAGLSLRTPQIIGGMGDWLLDRLANDAGERYWGALQSSMERWWQSLTPGIGGGIIGVVVSAVTGGVQLAVQAALTLMILFLMAVSHALGLAHAMWARMALGIAILLGPVFIPWIMVPPLSWLFWGWVKGVVLYSLYGVIAPAAFRVTAEMGILVLNQIAPPISPASPAVLPSIGLLLQYFGVALSFGVACWFALSRSAELCSVIVLGGHAAASGAGMQVARVRQMVRGR